MQGLRLTQTKEMFTTVANEWLNETMAMSGQTIVTKNL